MINMFKLYKFHQYACQNLFLFFCILYRKCMIISALYIVFCSFNSGIGFFFNSNLFSIENSRLSIDQPEHHKWVWKGLGKDEIVLKQ